VLEEYQLLDFANDGGLESTFHATTLPVFGIKIKAKYPKIAKKTLNTLLSFPASSL